MTITVATLSTGVTARVMARFGPLPTLVGGLATTIAALLLMTLPGVGASYFPDLLVPYLLMGVGLGTAMLPLLTIAMSGVPERDAGLASGVINVSMQLAGALGLAVLGTVATDRTHSLAASGLSQASALTGGYHLAFELGAMAVATGVALALVVLRPPRARRQEAVGSELALEL
jgi:MFS family permease